MAVADLSGLRLYYRQPPRSPTTEPGGCDRATYLMGSVRRIASAVWPQKSYHERYALVLVASRLLSRVLVSAPPPRSSFCTAVAAVFITGKLEYCPRLTNSIIFAVSSDLDQVLRCAFCKKRHSDDEHFVSILRTYFKLTCQVRVAELEQCKASACDAIHAEETFVFVTAGFDFDWDSGKIARRLSKTPTDRVTLELFFSIADFVSSHAELMHSTRLEELARSIAAVATALGKQNIINFDLTTLLQPEQELFTFWLNRLI